MRIACIHIPQVALQCATRIDPTLRGAAVAVVGAGRPQHSPVVTACSRAAHALGVRAGMTATIARELGATIATADASTVQETAHAIADALLAIAPRVDLGGRINGHFALYVE